MFRNCNCSNNFQNNNNDNQDQTFENSYDLIPNIFNENENPCTCGFNNSNTFPPF